MGLLFPAFYLVRTLRTMALTATFVPAFLASRFFFPSAGPVLLRRYIQALGGTYVKLGQILAMRYDLLPGAYCEELATLLDAVPPAPIARIVRAVERDLGRPLADCFLFFQPKPLGSASIAQVHEAFLHDGTPVVVKVQRPGVRQQFEADLFNAALIAWVGDQFRVLGPSSRLSHLVREVARVSRRELDFVPEARFAQYIHTYMREDSLPHYAPQVYGELSGESTITFERLNGVWMRDLVRAVQNGDQQRLEEWAQRGIEPERVGRLLLRSLLRQVLYHRVFHADPHAGNLVILDGGVLGFVDFGITGVLDRRLHEAQFRVYRTLAAGDVHAAYEAIIDTEEPVPKGDLSHLEDAIKDLLWDWVIAARSDDATMQEKSSGLLVLRVGDVLRQHDMRLPWRFLVFHRTTVIADQVIYALCPELNPAEEMRSFVRDFELETLRDSFAPERFLKAFLAAGDLAARLPVAMREIATQMEFKFPRFTRAYADQMSHIERVMLRTLAFGRQLAWLTGLGAVAYLLFARNGWWVDPELVDPRILYGTIAVAAVAVTYLAGVERSFEEDR